MTYSDTEVVDAAIEKFGFLVDEYDFKAVIKDARGTYLSQIVFQSSHLEIFIGVWGQGNEFWFTFTPLMLADAPAFELGDFLNGITKERNYFDQNIHDRVEWPIFTHTFPQYFERCAEELQKYCARIFAGDMSQWVDIAEQILIQRVEWHLRLQQRMDKLELTESDIKDLEPLVHYVKSRYPDISLAKIVTEVLDRLTR